MEKILIISSIILTAILGVALIFQGKVEAGLLAFILVELYTLRK